MGTAKTAQKASASADEFLCPEEVMAAAEALSADDKLKLDDIEKVRRRGTSFSEGELLHEVLCRVWLGKRKCPRDTSLMAFLVMSMKSIAGHDRAARKRTRTLGAVPREGAALPSATAIAQDVEQTIQETLERAQRALETVDDIFTLFDGDEEAQYLILGWSDGKRGAELREATGLDQAGCDRVAKRIRKKMRSLYPNGWTT
jgi:DNA-directed RNA polymerase specialized sigma24 family protein